MDGRGGRVRYIFPFRAPFVSVAFTVRRRYSQKGRQIDVWPFEEGDTNYAQIIVVPVSS